MATPWYRADPEAYARLRSEAEDCVPSLRFSERGKEAVLSGPYPVSDEHGQVIEQFKVELVFADHPSRSLPSLREVGGKVPYEPGQGNADRHVNPDGSACLHIEEEWWLQHPEGGLAVQELLRGPIYHWLVGQVMYEADGEWPWEARSHGTDGVLEAYQELLGVPDLQAAMRCLRALQRKRLHPRGDCPCGSGQTLEDCCLETFESIRERVPRKLLRQRWKVLSWGLQLKHLRQRSR